jgi:fatty-acyl-CoA synthase
MDIGLLIRDALGGGREGTAAELPALSLEDGPTWTYAELNAYANRCANALLGLGIGPGDRVGALLYNSLEYLGFYFGAARVGAVVVRLNWRLAAAELRFAIEDAGCRALVVHDRLAAELTDDVTAGVEHLVYLPYEDGEDEGAVEPPPGAHGEELFAAASTDEPEVAPPDSGDRLMIMYTSGTSGRPKGAVWTHGNSLAYAAMQATAYGFDAGSVAMTTGPLFHVGSLENLLLAALLVKGHGVLTRSGGFDSGRVLTAMERRGVTDALLQTSVLYDALRSGAIGARDLGAMRMLYTGGTDVERWALDALAEQAPGVAVSTLYGLTEGGACSTREVLDRDRLEEGSVGWPLPLTEVRIRREDGGDAAVDEAGEVCVRSGSSAREYWNKPEASAETFAGGWCRTGDLGRLRPDGRLQITGRLKDMIRSGGENIYPVEIENAVMELDAVIEVAVIAVPDEKYGETVCAVVVLADGAELSAEELVAHCRERLASYKKPRHVVFVDELPRSHTGKVEKAALREAYAHLGEVGVDA